MFPQLGDIREYLWRSAGTLNNTHSASQIPTPSPDEFLRQRFTKLDKWYNNTFFLTYRKMTTWETKQSHFVDATIFPVKIRILLKEKLKSFN